MQPHDYKSNFKTGGTRWSHCTDRHGKTFRAHCKGTLCVCVCVSLLSAPLLLFSSLNSSPVTIQYHVAQVASQESTYTYTPSPKNSRQVLYLRFSAFVFLQPCQNCEVKISISIAIVRISISLVLLDCAHGEDGQSVIMEQSKSDEGPSRFVILVTQFSIHY